MTESEISTAVLEKCEVCDGAIPLMDTTLIVMVEVDNGIIHPRRIHMRCEDEFMNMYEGIDVGP